MKFYLSFLITMVVIVAACNKPTQDDPEPEPGNGTDPNPNIDNTFIPADVKIMSSVTAYLDPYDRRQDINLFLSIPYASDRQEYDTGSYNFPVAEISKYSSSISVGRSQYGYAATLSAQRIFPVTDAIRNYVDVNKIPEVYVNDGFNFPMANEWNLPFNGKFRFTDQTFETRPHSMGIAYVNPTSRNFSFTISSTYADTLKQRWFLNSFGSFKFEAPAYFRRYGTAEIEFPVPSTLAGIAPDSIQAWNFNSRVWRPRGFAKKVDNAYRIKVDTAGFWNLAEPVKGVYKTFKVTTDAGVPVVNAALRISSDLREVAAARTDIHGNAVCFVPSGIILKLEIMDKWLDHNGQFNVPVFSSLLGSFSNGSPVEIKLPSSAPYVLTIKGDAISCGTGPMKNGLIRYGRWPGVELAHFPVKDGKYSGAVILDKFLSVGNVLKLTDLTTGTFGWDTIPVLRGGAENIVNISNCKPADLFMNFTLDGVDYSTTSPVKPEYQNNHVSLLISGKSNIQSPNLMFTTGLTATGSSIYDFISGIVVNRKGMQLDSQKPRKIEITRHDKLRVGFIEGSLDIYVTDNTNVSRHLVARFRIKVES